MKFNLTVRTKERPADPPTEKSITKPPSIKQPLAEYDGRSYARRDLENLRDEIAERLLREPNSAKQMDLIKELRAIDISLTQHAEHEKIANDIRDKQSTEQFLDQKKVAKAAYYFDQHLQLIAVALFRRYLGKMAQPSAAEIYALKLSIKWKLSPEQAREQADRILSAGMPLTHSKRETRRHPKKWELLPELEGVEPMLIGQTPAKIPAAGYYTDKPYERTPEGHRILGKMGPVRTGRR